MYLYNEIIIDIVNDINTLLCPGKSNNKRIELTVHTSCYWGLCYFSGLNMCTFMFLCFSFY